MKYERYMTYGYLLRLHRGTREIFCEILHPDFQLYSVGLPSLRYLAEILSCVRRSISFRISVHLNSDLYCDLVSSFYASVGNSCDYLYLILIFRSLPYLQLTVMKCNVQVFSRVDIERYCSISRQSNESRTHDTKLSYHSVDYIVRSFVDWI